MSQTYQRIISQPHFSPPSDWLQIKTIDMHTGGEPLRVILEGFPELRGNNVLDYRRDCRERFDHLRTALMFEPRGHADMYGCVLTLPNDEEGDFGILFLHNEGYSTMCGHAIIAISTLAVDMHWIDVVEGTNILKIDAPCGRITSFVEVIDGKVNGVRFHCVPSFAVGLDRTVDVKGIGPVNYDLAYGGAFYAYVDLSRNPNLVDAFHRGRDQTENVLTPPYNARLIDLGTRIKHAVMASDQEITHPFEADLSFLYGTIFIGDPMLEGSDSRNVCIFAEGEVDRCPTGSGVSGRMAIHKARREIDFGEFMTVESITDSRFIGSVVREEDYGPFKAVIPQVEGTAHITGAHTFLIDPNDPMRNGFFLR